MWGSYIRNASRHNYLCVGILAEQRKQFVFSVDAHSIPNVWGEGFPSADATPSTNVALSRGSTHPAYGGMEIYVKFISPAKGGLPFSLPLPLRGRVFVSLLCAGHIDAWAVSGSFVVARMLAFCLGASPKIKTMFTHPRNIIFNFGIN